MKNNVFVIAEAGVNHNGDIQLAKQLVDIAVAAKADAVKFQTFKAENVATATAAKAEYQIRTTGNEQSQLEMIKTFELPFEAFGELKIYAESRGIEFLSTPFDIESIHYLRSIGVPAMKIPSGEMNNYPYLVEIGKLKGRVIMSTGMATLREIGDSLEVLTSFGTKLDDITILHCNSAYPSPMSDINLNAMLTIKKEFGVKVGYSDHTEGLEASIAAVALGASIIEKHFTIDRNLPGPDHGASLEPNELVNLVRAIRNVESALGDGVKGPSKSEIINAPIARKSLVAKKSIKKGDLFSESNLTTKRPGTGISAMKWPEVIGKFSEKDYEAEDLI